MSTAPGFSLPDKVRRRSSSGHRRTDSGELDVFEAERYFSTTSESLPQKIGNMGTREEYHGRSTKQIGSWRQGRASLDMPMIMTHTQHTLPHPQEIILDTIKPIKEKKKHKQPSSPGGKLASFFNSLMNQTVSKKKNSSKSASQSVKGIVEEDSSGSWRRRRRSSISHFGTTASSTTTTRSTSKTTLSEFDAKSTKSCSSSLVSGFRTPPPHIIYTPMKPYKEFKAAFSNYNNNSPAALLQANVYPRSKPTTQCEVDYTTDFDPKKTRVNGSSEKHSSSEDSDYHSKAGLEKRINWVDRVTLEASRESRDFKIFMEEDGAESDSSSDLFELQLNPHQQHHQLGYCASDLPLYDSTRMDTIKISSGTPITNGPARN